jgi:putative copper resistance protein D
VQGFADFADGILGGTLLVALSVTLGGVVFAWLVVPGGNGDAERSVRVRCAGLVALSAAALALCQLAVLGLKTLLLADWLGPDAFARLLDTPPARAGIARAALSAALTVAAVALRRRPDAPGRLAIAGVLAGMVAVSGAWLVHAAGRLEHRSMLMALTVLHQVAAALWVGGLVHLGATWRLARRDAAVASLWPRVVARFSRLALGSVAALCVLAVPLARAFVGSVAGLVGTGYGALVLTKVVLLAAMLVLAAGNFAAVRRYRGGGGAAAVRDRVPILLEGETLLAIVLLFAAAGLSLQPPARDVTSERAAVAEVVEVFRPKWPAMQTPSVDTMLRDASDPFAMAGGERTAAGYSWSNFSHNVAGLVLLTMSVLALAGSRLGWSWTRHWPLGLAVLGVFVLLRSLAVDGVRPFGPNAFWTTTLDSAEAFQHRLAGLLAIVLGVLEWRARWSERPGARLPYVFPALGAVGGVLLLVHSHVAFEAKSSYLVQVTHTAMGLLAVLAACGRLLELRLPPPAGRAAGTASCVAMLLVALVLVFYREANVLVPPP